jgi:hypothetical protein
LSQLWLQSLTIGHDGETVFEPGRSWPRKADFTEQEWESLQKGVIGAGLLVSLSDRSFFDTFKEAGALGKHVAQAKQSSSSELVRELADIHGTGFGLTSSPDGERDASGVAERENDAGVEGPGRAAVIPTIRFRGRPLGGRRCRRRRNRRGQCDREDRVRAQVVRDAYAAQARLRS